jgi:hypothetical protein
MYAEEYSEVMEKSVEEERRQAEEAAEAARLEAEALAAAEAAAQGETVAEGDGEGAVVSEDGLEPAPDPVAEHAESMEVPAEANSDTTIVSDEVAREPEEQTPAESPAGDEKSES